MCSCFSGYALQEIIVALAVFAVALLPMMRGFFLVPRLGHALGEQGRREAWRTLEQQVVLAGVDPTQSPLLPAILPAGEGRGTPIAGLQEARINRRSLPSRLGRVHLTIMQESFGDIAEPRSAAAGLEIGSGLAIPPRVDPAPPLLPTVMPVPTLQPADGSVLYAGHLRPSATLGAPSTTPLTATVTGFIPIPQVRLRQELPQQQESRGLGGTEITLDALQLAQQVRGRAWSEYPGESGTDWAVELEDGRTRWIHPEPDGRMHVFEPSDLVSFSYFLGLGRPEYRIEDGSYASGSTVRVDYPTAERVGSDRSTAVITYPDEVRRSLGTHWDSIQPSFDWTFGSHRGDASSGDTRYLYSSEGRTLWVASQYLVASPRSALPGLRPLLQGTWVLERTPVVLDPPERTGPYFDGSTDAPGNLDYSAPVLPRVGRRVGRPEINGIESTGETLSVPVVP